MPAPESATSEQPSDTPECDFCETCGCCFLHSDCSPNYCACAPCIYGSGPIEEND